MTMHHHDTSWYRNKLGMGLWPYRGKVSISGWGISPVARRFEPTSLDTSLGAYAILACERAMEDAGVRPEDIDGLICCPDSADGTGGPAGDWGPTRPYFAPPYDSEDGLGVVSGKWLSKQMPQLKNLKYVPDDVVGIVEGQLGQAAEMVGSGKCHTALVVYTMANLGGRYRRGGPDNTSNTATGGRQWGYPWGMSGGNQFSNTMAIQQYLQKFGGNWDDLLTPFVLNQHRNGLMHPWSFYSTQGPAGLNREEYLSSRMIIWPVRIWDCDRPMHVVTAFLFTTAERARNMKTKPVYVLNHTEGSTGKRSSLDTLEDLQAGCSLAAKLMWEGSGLSPRDVDVFNPYDGYATMTPFAMEGFGWQGLKQGEAYAMLTGDIRVEGPHPYSSSGGNLGNGRTRTAMQIDAIEQLRGTAGKLQIKGAEVAIGSSCPVTNLNYIALGKNPN